MFNPEHGFRYLSCDTGHWTLGRVLQRSIATATDRYGRGLVRYKGKQFDQFSQYDCHTHYVMGEFFWQVNKNDKNFVIDYICAPGVLSRERAEKEINWSYSEYVPRELVAKGFGIKPDDLPDQSGVGMAGPLPASRRSSFFKMALISLVSLVLTHLLFTVLGVNQDLVKLRTMPLNAEIESHSVKLKGSRPSNVVVDITSNINEDSVTIAVDLERIDGSEPVREMRHSLSYYSGYEGGESWSEGNQNPRIVFLAVPPGDYKVSVIAQHDEGTPRKPTVRYDVTQQGKPNLWPFLLGTAVLLVLGGLGVFREPNPESLRWQNSQYGTRPGRRAQLFDDDDDD